MQFIKKSYANAIYVYMGKVSRKNKRLARKYYDFGSFGKEYSLKCMKLADLLIHFAIFSSKSDAKRKGIKGEVPYGWSELRIGKTYLGILNLCKK